MTAPTAPADLTGVDLDLVDETWEDVPCEMDNCETPCTEPASRFVKWRCGCTVTYCPLHFRVALSYEDDLDACWCSEHGSFSTPGIVRTWPVTR